jgi:hypothetical protein
LAALAWCLLASLAVAQQKPSSGGAVPALAPTATAAVPQAFSPFATSQPVAFQQPDLPLRGAPDIPLRPEQAAIQDIAIQLEPPPFEQLYAVLQSEKDFQETMRQEALSRNPPQKISFPVEPILTRETYQRRYCGPLAMVVEPYYVGYGKLLFEQKNFERYGWDMGPTQPIMDFAVFYADVITMPYHFFSDPFRLWEYNTGYALPGDPIPLYLYPPELSITGATFQTAAVLAILAIFP